ALPTEWPSKKYSTSVTPTLSEALADIAISPPRVAPSAGSSRVTVGGVESLGAASTVNCAEACIEFRCAVTANGPPGDEPAVNRPLESMLPPPLTSHDAPGTASATPNWL